MYETDILQFKGEYDWLSNFYRQSFRYKSIFWPTSEHAFQAMKIYRASYLAFRQDLVDVWPTVFPNTPKPTVGWVSEEVFMREFARISTPGRAKRMGRLLPKRPNWDKVRVDVMLDILRHKFAPGTPLAYALLKTGARHLEEGNTWKDDFWGVDLYKGIGDNHLGKLLMQVREELELDQQGR